MGERRRGSTKPPPALIRGSTEGSFLYAGRILPSDSPVAQARKMLSSDRDGVYLSTTLDEEDALYTEVVLSDDEVVENYFAVDDEYDEEDDEDDEEEDDCDDDEDSCSSEEENDVCDYVDIISNHHRATSTGGLLRTPVSSPLRVGAPSPYLSTRATRAMLNNGSSQSDDGRVQDDDNNGSYYNYNNPNEQQDNNEQPDEEKEFRIRHLLNYGDSMLAPPNLNHHTTTTTTTTTATMPPPPPPPPMIAVESPLIRTPSSSSRRGGGGHNILNNSSSSNNNNNRRWKSRSHGYEAALLIEDKPWRTPSTNRHHHHHHHHNNPTHLPPPGPGFRNKNYTATQQQPQHATGGRSFLGRFTRGNSYHKRIGFDPQEEEQNEESTMVVGEGGGGEENSDHNHHPGTSSQQQHRQPHPLKTPNNKQPPPPPSSHKKKHSSGRFSTTRSTSKIQQQQQNMEDTTETYEQQQQPEESMGEENWDNNGAATPFRPLSQQQQLLKTPASAKISHRKKQHSDIPKEHVRKPSGSHHHRRRSSQGSLASVIIMSTPAPTEKYEAAAMIATTTATKQQRSSHPVMALETALSMEERAAEREDHDMVVEAASLPSSDGSSFGDGDDSSYQRDAAWDDFFLQDDDDNNNDTMDSKKNTFEWERPVDWNMLAEYPLPTHFPHTTTVMGSYPRRASSSSGLTVSTSSLPDHLFTQQRASHFVWQHGMLLDAMLQLLVERECLGIEGSMDAVDNVWKKGPLKKLARENKGLKKWKVKYVEVRRGNLCYYEDHGGESGRKSIHLRSSDTQVRQVSSAMTSSVLSTPSSSAAAGYYMFEIVQSGSPTRLWMAQSEEDLQAWMRAIQAAMIGDEDDVDNGGGDEITRLQDLAPHHQTAIARFTELQSKLKTYDLHEDYVAAVKTLGTNNNNNNNNSNDEYNNNNSSSSSIHNTGGSGSAIGGMLSLQIPVSWIRQQVQDLGGGSSTANGKSKKAVDRFKPRLIHGTSTDPQKQIRASIAEFWNNMKETAFAINGMAVPREMPCCAERIFGSLTRCILEYDHAIVQDTEIDNCYDFSSAQQPPSLISETQAVAYARDILVTVLRTREQQDVLYAVNDLLRNDDLVVLSTKEEDDICHLEVSFAGEDWQDITRSEAVGDCDMTIWINTKRKNSPASTWRKRFAVLSGVVLSYYQAALPRPHGLRGQLVINRSSTVATREELNKAEGRPRESTEPNVLVVSTKDEVRYLSFEREQDMMAWKEAIQNAINSCDDIDSKEARAKEAEQQQQQRSLKLRVLGSRVLGSRVVKGGFKAFRNRLTQQNRAIIAHAAHTTNTAAAVNAVAAAAFKEPPAKTVPTVALAATGAIIPERPSMELLMNKTPTSHNLQNPNSSSNNSKQREPTVQCVVQHLHRFVIRDRFVAAKSEDERDGLLFTVHAKLFQAFTMSGGANGRLLRGNGLVEIDIAEVPSNYDDETERSYY